MCHRLDYVFVAGDLLKGIDAFNTEFEKLEILTKDDSLSVHDKNIMDTIQTPYHLIYNTFKNGVCKRMMSVEAAHSVWKLLNAVKQTPQDHLDLDSSRLFNKVSEIVCALHGCARRIRLNLPEELETGTYLKDAV